MAAELSPEIDGLLQSARRQFQLNHPEEAQRLAEEALRRAPSHVPALNLRGMLWDAQGRLAEARADFERVLALEPHNADALTNRAITHARVGEYAEALALYNRSLMLAPGQPHAVYNRSVVRLALGDWVRGFREFESRWDIFPHEAARLTRLAPRWLGNTDLSGKTILLHHEQGYGDTLQFSRYVPLVAARGARVMLAVPAALQALMTTLPGGAQLIGEGAKIPAHDFHCPLMSLGLAFATTPETVPAPIPYLSADPKKVAFWGKRLSRLPGPKVGLVWTGRRYPPINHARDMALEWLHPFFGCKASFVVLQTELTDEEKSRLEAIPTVSCHGGELVDFSDTAALVENLDLVISVDSAVAHLTGALGKPVWLMNRYASCWRWLMDRRDTPWYPTMRLFRQPAFGDWTSVVAAVTRALEEFVDTETRRPNKKTKTPRAPVRRTMSTSSTVLKILQGALAQHGQGQWTEAIAAYRKVLESAPEEPAALHYLGVALAQTGDYESAVQHLERAAAALPKDAVVHNHLGNALAGWGKHKEAIECYERSIELNPEFADAHYNQGVALTVVEQETAAIQSFERAIALKADYAEAYNNLGNLLSESERRGETLGCYERALALRPHFIDALVNRTNWLRRLHRYQEALQTCEAALQIAPEHAPLHSAHGATLAAVGQADAAFLSYQRALALNPALSEATWNLGLLYLLRGEYREGWSRYESRWQVKSLRLTRKFPHQAPWTGSENIQGKTVLLHAEQGYGDTIQFARYARLVTARGARAVLMVPQALQKILQSMPSVAEVVTPEARVAFDQHCPLLSLPRAFATEIKTIPANVPYLFAESAARARWAERLGARVNVRVGLAWSGRATHANDGNRSIAFEQLAALLDLPVDWVSLQQDIRPSDATNCAHVVKLRRRDKEFVDFADTAALIAELDLVISVDTAVAHLAGALGKPVWLMLPFVADWRWLQTRVDSPWYPSARLYRQERPGDWQTVLHRVRQHLEALTTPSR